MLDSASTTDATDFRTATSSPSLYQNKLAVNLVSNDPGLPLRLNSAEPDSQCDCACFAVEADFLPRLRTPVSFYLELTPYCNNTCFSCGNVFSDRKSLRSPAVHPPPLTQRQWTRILQKLQPIARSLRLTGGEPTLHPEFESIAAVASSMRLPFTVFTNALWDAPRRLCARLGDLTAFQGLLVSLHGPTPDSHEAFTGRHGSFVQTLANIRTAVRAGINTSISCVITRHNWNLIQDMVELVEGSRAGSVVFNRLLEPQGDDLVPEPEELRMAVRTIQALRASGKALKLGTCLPSCFVSTDQAGCLAGLAFFTVDPWGRVRPCNHAHIICGDLLRQSVEDIWHSPALEQWRNTYPEECGTCSAYTFCRGGCRAQAVDLGQAADPLMTEPLTSPWVYEDLAITLYENARPKGLFTQRPEEFGTLLLGQNRLYPVGSALQATLDSLDGRTTLRQIKIVHGQSGLNLVASLYRQGMIELQIP